MATPKTEIPSYLLLLTLLTVIYLSYELAFNARLLDVAGSLATPTQIDSIQWWGRVISGLAVALGIVGAILMPHADKKNWSLVRKVLTFGVVAMLAVRVTFWFEKAAVDYFVDNSTGAQRNLAAHLTLLTHGILTHDITLDGIDLDKEKLATPEGKTFVAVFPLGAFAFNNLRTIRDDLTERLVRGLVSDNIGSPEHYYNTVYRPSAQSIRRAYNDYAQGSNELNQALSGIPDQQQQAWWRYTGRLRARRQTPNTIKPFWWGRVRQDVQRDGVPVANNWTPSDQQGFYAAIRRRVEEEAYSRYKSAMSQQLGAGETVPPGLDINSFVHQPAVQRKWAQQLGGEPKSDLRLAETVQEVTPQLYAPTFDRATRDTLADYEAGDAGLADEGSHAEFGRNAMRAVLVPPIALAFSLSGMLFHLGKLSDCLLRFLPGRRSSKLVLILAILGTVIVEVFYLPNPVSTSHVFGKLQQVMQNPRGPFRPFGWPIELAVTWTTQAQPYAYPVNEAIRKILPGQPTFGYEPKTPALAYYDNSIVEGEH